MEKETKKDSEKITRRDFIKAVSGTLAVANLPCLPKAIANTISDFGTSEWGKVMACAINAAGQVAGYSHYPSEVVCPPATAFLWETGDITELGALPGCLYSRTGGINASGQIVGYCSTPGCTAKAFIWDSGSMTEINPSATHENYATDINNSGQVAGYFRQIDQIASEAFRWQSGVKTDLGALGGASSEAHGINETGQVVGWAESINDLGVPGGWDVKSNTARGVTAVSDTWLTINQGYCDGSGGAVLEIQFLDSGTAANDETAITVDLAVGSSTGVDFSLASIVSQINTASLALGWAADGTYLAYSAAESVIDTTSSKYVLKVVSRDSTSDSYTMDLYNNAAGTISAGLTALGAFTAENNVSTPTVATSVTAVGMAAGVARPGIEIITKSAFLWNSGTMSDLGTLGGDYSKACDINDSEEIVGYSKNASDNMRAFIWDSTNGMRSLGTLGGDESKAYAINNNGDVVGYARNSLNDRRAFLWSNDQMIDLNTLLAPGSGWTLLEVRDINDNNEIVGYGLIDGELHAFHLEVTDSGIYAIQDLNKDYKIDFKDFNILATKWKKTDSDPGWNSEYDIFEPKDGVINGRDLAKLTEKWLDGTG